MTYERRSAKKASGNASQVCNFHTKATTTWRTTVPAALADLTKITALWSSQHIVFVETGSQMCSFFISAATLLSVHPSLPETCDHCFTLLVQSASCLAYVVILKDMAPPQALTICPVWNSCCFGNSDIIVLVVSETCCKMPFRLRLTCAAAIVTVI